MSFDREFLEMMPHTITVRHRASGRDRKGNPNLGVATYYKCRVVGKILSERSAHSQDYSQIFTIYIGAKITGSSYSSVEAVVFTTEDEITLPDQTTFGDGKIVIFTVSRLTDEDGHHHIVVSCGWMYHRQGSVS